MDALSDGKTVADFEAIIRKAEEGIRRLKAPQWGVGDTVESWDSKLLVIDLYVDGKRRYGFVDVTDGKGALHTDSLEALKDMWPNLKKVN